MTGRLKIQGDKKALLDFLLERKFPVDEKLNLPDLDLKISARSSETDISNLIKLMKAILASSTSISKEDIVLIESKQEIVISFEKKLVSIVWNLQSKEKP